MLGFELSSASLECMRAKVHKQTGVYVRKEHILERRTICTRIIIMNSSSGSHDASHVTLYINLCLRVPGGRAVAAANICDIFLSRFLCLYKSAACGCFIQKRCAL